MQFWKGIEKNLASGFAFLILSIMLVTGLTQKDFLEKKVFNQLPSEVSGPYFYALVSGKENHLRLSRKLGELPGVALVSVLDKNEINTKVGEILESLGLDSGTGMFDFDYAGLKIIFKEGISDRSQDLIRDYLVRLAGKDKVTLGVTKDNDNIIKKHNATLLSFKRWGAVLTIALIFTLWVSSAFSFGKKLKEMCYIVESFQRKERVGLKVYLTGFVIISLFSLQTFLWGTPNLIYFFVGIATILMFSLSFITRYQWNR